MLPYSNKTIKNKFLIIFFFLALINSCKKKETIKSIKNVKDTIRVNCKKCIIDLSFDKTKLDPLKEKYPNDNFYIIADDANFYTSNVIDFLKQEKKEIIKIKMTSNSILKINNEFVIPYEKLNYWDYILCLNSKKPKITSPIDFIDNYHKFYIEDETKTNKSNRIENFNSSNLDASFFGKYHLTQDKGKIDEFSSIVIGYNIEIKKDSVFFSGQGYQTNFYDLCRVKKDKDTLKLYYYKSLEGTDYNKNKKQPLVKLYKKCSDYYVKSPSIWVDAKPNVEVKFEKTNFYSCKSSENNNVIIKKASFSDSKIHIELSNKKKLTFKAVYFLEDETPIISVKDNRIISSYSDHYGNYIEAKWVFNSDDKNLYLVDITGAFPLKNKMKDNFKDCVLHNLSKNINTINTDELFDILFNSCNCTYR